jgi:hypothetical protein
MPTHKPGVKCFDEARCDNAAPIGGPSALYSSLRSKPQAAPADIT